MNQERWLASTLSVQPAWSSSPARDRWVGPQRKRSRRLAAVRKSRSLVPSAVPILPCLQMGLMVSFSAIVILTEDYVAGKP